MDRNASPSRGTPAPSNAWHSTALATCWRHAVTTGQFTFGTSESGEERVIGTEHIRDLTAIDFAPSGKILASVSEYGIVKYWDSSSGQRLRPPLIRHPQCSALRYLDEERIVTASSAGSLRVWEISSAEILAENQTPIGGITAIDLSPTRQWIAAAGEDRKVTLWDASTGQLLRLFDGHTNAVTGVRFHPKGQLLASCDESGMVRFWDVDTGLVTNSINASSREITAIDFTPDGRKFAVADASGAASLFRTGTGELSAVLEAHRGKVTDVAFSRDGTALATSSMDRTVSLWHASGPDFDVTRAHISGVNALEWIPDAGLISAGAEGVLCCDAEHMTSEIGGWQLPSAPVTAVAAHPEKQEACVATADGRIFLCSLADHASVRSFRAHYNIIDDVAYHPDGKVLATVARDGDIRLWDRSTRELLRLIDLTLPLTIADNSSNPSVSYSLEFQPDGSHLLCSGNANGTVLVWNTSNWNVSKRLIGHSAPVRALAFHPQDHTQLLTSSADATVRIWNLTTARELARLSGHTGDVFDARFSPDGSFIASGGEDHRIYLWDAHSHRLSDVLEGHVGTVRALRFRSDGNRIVSAGEDGTLRTWDLTRQSIDHYTRQFTHFKTDGVTFAVDLPPIAARLGEVVRSGAGHALPQDHSNTPPESALEVSRRQFWRTLRGEHWEAARQRLLRLPGDDREAEQRALCHATASESLASDDPEAAAHLLAIAESIAPDAPNVTATRSILTLRNNPTKVDLHSSDAFIESLPVDAQHEKRSVLTELLTAALKTDSFPAARNAMETLEQQFGDSDESDHHYPQFADYYRRQANLSDVALRALALIEILPPRHLTGAV